MRALVFIPLFFFSLVCSVIAKEAPGPWTIEAHGLVVHPQGVSDPMRDDVQQIVTQQLALANDTEMSPPLADDMAYFVNQRYWQSGYRKATVTWRIEDRHAVLEVTEGPLFHIGTLTFEGSDEGDDKDALTKYLLRPTHERSGETGDPTPAVEADLEAGTGLVQRYLMSLGYLDAAVDAPVLEIDQAAGVIDVTIKMTKGQRYSVGDISLSGDLLNREAEAKLLVKALQNEPFNEVEVDTLSASMASLYQEQGYFAAKVEPKVIPSPANAGQINIDLTVAPGNKHRVASINVSSALSHGAQRLIHAAFKPIVGKTYIPPNIALMNRSLLGTEMFNRLDVTPHAIGNDQLDLEITGTEGPRRRLGLYGGFQTFQGYVVGAEWRHANLWDTGDALRLKAEMNGRGIDSGIKWVDPAFLNSAFSLDVDLSAQTFTFFDYDRRSVALRTRLSRQWNAHITTSLFSEVSLNVSESAVLNPQELGPDDYRIVSLGTSVNFDYRNNPVSPTKGWLASGSIVAAQDVGGSGVAFLRSEINTAYYQPITKKLRAAVSARTSAIQTSDGVESLPIDLRIFNGGATTVRSFPEREMGLRSKSGTPLGGTLAQVFNAELSYEIISNLEFAIFADAGNLSRDDDNPTAFPSDLSYAVGAGLRYKLPVGPLRIDYGYNPDRREGEPSGALHITFGFAF